MGLAKDENYSAEIDGFPQSDPGDEETPRDELEILLSDFMEKLRLGQNPLIEDYVQNNRHLKDQIMEIFPLVSAMENCKARQETTILREQIALADSFESIGPCQLLRRIGSGGMGVVYEGYHEELKRRVAVKMLPSRFSPHSAFRRRFQREAQTASRLDHRNIVPVLESGEEDGFCFHVMPFVEGVNLDWVIHRLRQSDAIVHVKEIEQLHSQLEDVTGHKSERLLVGTSVPETGKSLLPNMESPTGQERSIPRDSWLKLTLIILQTADALRYAHKQGTIHRDVKPANLLLDKDGRVWITDFGLAIPLEDSDDEQINDLAGTLRYMAPERFRGQCDVRADIYSLGMTFYELLTLELAFTEKDRRELIADICTERIPRPREVCKEIPRELEAVILKALQKDPARRYQTAGEFLSDLLLFVNRKPVLAPLVSRQQRIAEWIGDRMRARRRKRNQPSE